MNVFHKFTRKSLAQNPTRTIVTIIGILLSMSLFTAVIEGAYSGIQFLQNSEIQRSGAWHGYYSDLTQESASEFLTKPGIDKAVEFSRVGWAKV